MYHEKYDIGEKSSIGILTSNRKHELSGSNTAAALDANINLSEKYILSAIAAVTKTDEPNDVALSENITESEFTVRDQIKTSAFDGESFYGHLLRAKLQRSSRRLTSTLAFQDFSPGFRTENGFIAINSFRNIESVNTYYFRFDNHHLFTSIAPNISIWRRYNYDNVVKDTGIRTSLRFNFHKQTRVILNTFIFNRENLHGKQFDDARLVWVFVRSNMHKAITGFFLLNVGKQINRVGIDGDRKNPFEIVPSMNFRIGFTIKPSAKIINDISFRNFVLWHDYSTNKIMGQKIFRNSLAYQFNRNMFIRLIAEYNIIDYHISEDYDMVHQKFFTLDPQISYKLNAFSVFYLGAHLGARNNLYKNWNDLRMNNQSVYLKFQYLFQY